jgi:ElaB/YqjD/DUF883 family membrane-anchored ribosome-binding protein
MSSAQENFRQVKDDAKERFATDLEQLKANFGQLRRDVSQVLHDALGAGKSSARGGLDSAKDYAQTGVERVKDGYDDLKHRGQDQLDQLGQFVSEKPVASALIAFGVGFVLAKLMGRR